MTATTVTKFYVWKNRQNIHFEFRRIGEWCANNKEITQISEKLFPNAQSGFGNSILKVAFNEVSSHLPLTFFFFFSDSVNVLGTVVVIFYAKLIVFSYYRQLIFY